jgi:hypothetical protein
MPSGCHPTASRFAFWYAELPITSATRLFASAGSLKSQAEQIAGPMVPIFLHNFNNLLWVEIFCSARNFANVRHDLGRFCWTK